MTGSNWAEVVRQRVTARPFISRLNVVNLSSRLYSRQTLQLGHYCEFQDLSASVNLTSPADSDHCTNQRDGFCDVVSISLRDPF